MNIQPFSPSDHLSSTMIAGYLDPNGSPEEKEQMAAHCVTCAACREQLALVAMALSPKTELAQEKEFAVLLRVGEKAAQQARPQKKSRWFDWFLHPRPVLATAAVTVLLAIVLVGYYRWQRTQPLERSLASLRQAWTQSRPIEARVTGDFPYLPYQVTRSANSSAADNPDQLMAATAELSREVADKPSSQAHQALGKLHLLKAEFAQAEKKLRDAIQADPNNAAAYVDLAALFYERGRREQSVQEFQKAVEQCDQAIKLAPQLSEAWFNRALCHEQMMLLTKAIADWEEYLKLDPSSRWAEEARKHLQELKVRTARLLAPPVKELAKALQDAAAEPTRLRQLVAENYAEVSSLFQGQLLSNYVTMRLQGNTEQTTQQWQLLQQLSQGLEENNEERFFSDLLTFVQRADTAQLQQISVVQNTLQQAQEKYGKGEYVQAVALYTTAQTQAEHIGDICHQELALYGLASINTPQTETAATPALRERLIAETRRNQHLQLQAKALLALANQYGAAQIFSPQLALFAQAQEVSERLKDADTLMNVLRFWGQTHSSLGDHAAALVKNHAALQVLSQQRPSVLRICQAYSEMAEVLARARAHAVALAYQLEALPYCERCNNLVYATVQGRAGFYYSMTGQNQAAAEILQNAIARAEDYGKRTGNRAALFDLYCFLGDVFTQQKRPQEAQAAYQQSQALVTPKYKHYLAAIHQGLATAYLQQDHVSEAEAELKQGIRLAEQARAQIAESRDRGMFLNARLDIYRTMVELQYLGKQNFTSAFDYAEVYRNRELLNALTNVPTGATQQRTLSYSSKVVPLTYRQVQRALPHNVQLIEYAITEQALLIWVLTSEAQYNQAVEITDDALQHSVLAYLKELRQRSDAQTLTVRATELYRLLLLPIRAALDPQRAVVIVPDGILSALPFAALVNPVSQQYLVEEYTLMINPSASVLIHTLQRSRTKLRSAAEPLLILSNPKFDYTRYPELTPLPGTEQELAALQSLYPQSETLHQDRATKRLLLEKAGQYEVVHLATHSQVNEQNPLLSVVLLGVDEQSPGQTPSTELRAEEIFQLRLPRTRLVILSSCRSGVTPQAADLGVGGLAHAFFSAGVPSVLASLWEVEDESTAVLMKHFHTVHRQGKKPFGEALRQAQLRLLKSEDRRWQHPYYWASFLLTGDGITA